MQFSSINAIIVDDERGCTENLQHYLKECCPQIKVVAVAENASDALSVLKNQKVTLAFLDIQLHRSNIFEDVLELIALDELMIVFVTAYQHYAVRAFHVSAVDYILKPLQREHIIRCYQKIMDRHQYRDYARLKGQQDVPCKKIILKHGEEIYLLYADDIIYLSAKGFYTEVCFNYQDTRKTILYSKPIHAVHSEWDHKHLLRIHRSHVVNLKKIAGLKKKHSGYYVELADHREMPVSRAHVSELLSAYHA